MHPKAIATLGNRAASSLSDLKAEMTSRELPQLLDTSNSQQAMSLSVALSDFVQKESYPMKGLTREIMPRGYHLVYFPPATSQTSLLPDGTDPLHSPGPPFTRRMWAGGDISFRERGCSLRGREMRCNESITDVEIKGKEGEEKVFVTIRRELAYKIRDGGYTPEGQFLVENRTLVFMRDHQNSQTSATERAILKPSHDADFSHKLTPTAALLSKFSELTSNGHKIHLDKQYCQDVEGHRNLLVHGPLSVVLMLEILQGYTRFEAQQMAQKSHDLQLFEYRNLAPLYAEEEMKVCLRRKDDLVYETWIEGPDGGLAVRGTATMKLRADRIQTPKPQPRKLPEPLPMYKTRNDPTNLVKRSYTSAKQSYKPRNNPA
ncbi:MAG: hypothetical protein Q9218_005898 [Villophora microphyllina]